MADALHETNCAVPSKGWAPQYVLLKENGALKAAMPLYLKGHSYGEYVFDWAWADAYHRHGLRYYPKLLCAVPFTPVLENAYRPDVARIVEAVRRLVMRWG